MRGGVIITGDKRIDAILREMAPRLQKKLSRQASRKAAKDIVLPAAKDRVPVNTGDLEDALTVRSVTRSRTRVGHYVGTKEGDFEGDQFYGGFIEFGTKERQHKSGKGVGRIDPAKNLAFLRPALYDNAERVHDVYMDSMREFIKETK